MKQPTRIFKVEIKAEANYGDEYGWTTINETGNFVAKNAEEAIDIAKAVLFSTSPFEDDNKKTITPKFKNIDTLNVILLAESDL